MTSEDSFEDAQAAVAYVPVIIPYSEGMPKRRWEPVPGVTLMPTPESLKKLFNDSELSRFALRYGNYVIRIEKRAYLLHAKKRLHQFKEGQPSFFYAQSIAKNLILSVSLERPNAGFVVGGHFSGREEKGDFIASGYANISSGRRAGHEELSPHRVRYEPKKTLNRKSAALNFCRLEQYFLSPMTGNTVRIKSDRVAVAVQGIWAALSTPHDDQAFITFAMVLEALLTTAQTEVTLQIAERAAVLIGKTRADRYDLYRSVKRLYGIRSKLVHGAGIQKKKAKEPHNIHPSFSTIPLEALREIGAIAIRVLRTVLHDDTLYQIAQDKDQQKLDKFYVERLMS